MSTQASPDRASIIASTQASLGQAPQAKLLYPGLIGRSFDTHVHPGVTNNKKVAELSISILSEGEKSKNSSGCQKKTTSAAGSSAPSFLARTLQFSSTEANAFHLCILQQQINWKLAKISRVQTKMIIFDLPGDAKWMTGTWYSDQLNDQALFHCFRGEESIYKATEEKTGAPP